MKGFQREQDFDQRREHLANLSDEELKTLFWQKMEEIVKPLLDLAYENTSPSIERSVLLRMGFSSIEAQELVERATDLGLMGYGVGHVVYVTSKEQNLPLREAGLKLIEGEFWQEAKDYLEAQDDAE